MSSTGFIPNKPRVSKYRDTISSSSVPVPPEEALFRRRRAPERYEEDDFYWADRHLTEKQTLPESDLLKAMHTYASDFYGRGTKYGGLVDFESMDETALICLGILLEEMAEHVLGETGDLAFVEGEEIDETNLDEIRKGKEREMPERLMTTSEAASDAVASDAVEVRTPKRRKTKHAGDDIG